MVVAPAVAAPSAPGHPPPPPPPAAPPSIPAPPPTPSASSDPATEASPPASSASAASAASEAAAASLLRFEDLTVDDDLPPVERVVRYVRSGIALQRLVHVKMMGEAARIGGTAVTLETLLPLVPPLVTDAESIIRQHLAAQLLPLGLTCMYDCRPGEPAVPLDGGAGGGAETTSSFPTSIHVDGGGGAGDGGGRGRGGGGGGGRGNAGSGGEGERPYHPTGYAVLTASIVPHLSALAGDADVDVRRAASDSLASLGMRVRPSDVAGLVLPVPLRLAREGADDRGGMEGGEMSDERRAHAEDLRITAANLLADLASLPPPRMTPRLVSARILPPVLALCGDESSFRVRRAAVQSLPRVLAASSEADVGARVLPAFERLSRDEMYRVRKSVGECLVDMSRSLMLVPGNLLGRSAHHPPSAHGHGHGHGHSDGAGVPHSRGGSDEVSLSDVLRLGPAADRDEYARTMERMRSLRRSVLVPVAERLLRDPNKFVRHGMMQFLGPFIASFYPLDGGPGDAGAAGGGGRSGAGAGAAARAAASISSKSVMELLEDEAFFGLTGGGSGASLSTSAGAGVGGVGAQFFPHANGMVGRLNPAGAAAAALAGAGPPPPRPPHRSDADAAGGGGGSDQAQAREEELRALLDRLPPFLRRPRRDASVLDAILAHRSRRPPAPEDLEAVRASLLPHFV